jgi:hypothetical protein
LVTFFIAVFLAFSNLSWDVLALFFNLSRKGELVRMDDFLLWLFLFLVLGSAWGTGYISSIDTELKTVADVLEVDERVSSCKMETS